MGCRQIPIYSAEAELGLAEIILTSGRIAYASQANLTKPFSLPKELAKVAKATNEGQVDLHYLDTILVSTGWNLNDDVFDRGEVWAARATPEDKPFNYEHTCSDIIGHITSNWAIDEKEKVIADSETVDKLPAKFHIVTGAVLYKVWEDSVLQERMDKILAEIAEAKWFVSMEALFTDFDYALRDKAGKSKVIARNEETAFLTKTLRAYGGTGDYQEYKVGRLLRNIVFSGKGLVRQPANPDSIIFSKANISPFLPGPGYAPLTETVTTKVETKKMSDTLDKQVADLKSENDRLALLVKENDEKNWKAQLAAKDEQLAALTSAKTKLEADLTANASQLVEAQKKISEVETALKTVSAEIENAKADKKKADRVNLLVDKLKVTREVAEQSVANLLPLTDEQFASHVEAMTAWVTNNPQAGNTSFPHTAAKPEPKTTPAPNAPKATPAPVQTGKADILDIFDSAIPNTDASLNSTSAAIEPDLAMAIAKQMGYVPAKENK